jgi:hypothetical protein
MYYHMRLGIVRMLQQRGLGFFFVWMRPEWTIELNEFGSSSNFCGCWAAVQQPPTTSEVVG